MATRLATFVSLITPKRRWLQFSLNTVFVVITAVCVWLAVLANAANRQRQAVANIAHLGGQVKYDVPRMGRSNRTSPFPEWIK